MQVASRQCLWGETGLGTEVVVELNEETGLYLNFLVRFVDDRPVRISWGDGAYSFVEARNVDTFEEHTYARPGRYKIWFTVVRSIPTTLRFCRLLTIPASCSRSTPARSRRRSTSRGSSPPPRGGSGSAPSHTAGSSGR